MLFSSLNVDGIVGWPQLARDFLVSKFGILKCQSEDACCKIAGHNRASARFAKRLLNCLIRFSFTLQPLFNQGLAASHHNLVPFLGGKVGRVFDTVLYKLAQEFRGLGASLRKDALVEMRPVSRSR